MVNTSEEIVKLVKYYVLEWTDVNKVDTKIDTI